MNTEKEKFELLWADFTTVVRGRLRSAVNKKILTTSYANMVLADAALSWGVDYETYGRWLDGYRMNHPRETELICEILLKDMKFVDVRQKFLLPQYCNFLIPFTGAILGYSISGFSELTKVAQVASAVLPPIVLYPAVKTFRNRQNESNNNFVVNQYMEQLSMYKNSIISILS